MAKSKKVNKWDAAPESIKQLKEAINGTVDGLSIAGELADADEWEQNLINILGKVLDDYNELEAKHNADCGLISKLEEENKAYETLAAGLHNDVDELERTINDLEKMVEFHKGEVKELVKTADKVRDKHENDVCMLKKDIHDLEVKVKYYKEDADDLECEVSKYKALYEGLQLTVDSVTRERNHFEYTLSQLIEQLKIKNDIYVDIDECVDGNYKVEDKHVAVLQEDLDAAILDLKKEDENCQSLNKLITRKNTEMCNLKWERDEAEKKIEILTEELKRRYDINVIFYQRPGYDIHGMRNIGVHVDCEENRKTFLELKEKLAEEQKRHEKATRYISALTKDLNNAGVDFHCVKIGDDGEWTFHIDSIIDKCARKHYEEQYNRLRDIIRNYEAQIYKLKKDRGEIDHRNLLLLKTLDRAGIRPSFDNLNDKWLIQYTDKAENAFLAADQIKRDAEKKIDKLVSALDKCHMKAKWDCENDKWRIYVRPSDTEVTGVSFDLCGVIEGYEKLKKENDNLKQTLLNILETLEMKVGLCRVHLLDSYEDRANLIAVEHDRLLIKYEKLKKENARLKSDIDEYETTIYELEEEKMKLGKDIYKLAVDGYNNRTFFKYAKIAEMLRCKHRITCPVVCDCTNCKNYDPKE